MRTLSEAFKEVLSAQTTGDGVIGLVTIDHDDLALPVRVTDAGENVVSNGETFLHCPFYFKLVSEPEQGGFRGYIEVSNVEPDVVYAIRQIETPPTVLIQLVLMSNTDYVEIELAGLQLVNASYDDGQVSGDLLYRSLEMDDYPKGRFTPSLFPGLFNVSS